MKVQPRDLRVQRFLDRHLTAPAYRWGDLTDPRDRRGRRWALAELVSAAFCGLLAGCPTLREVEAATEDAGGWVRQRVPRRAPDTTLWDLLPQLDVGELRAKLHQQVRGAWRRKALTPVELPCGVVAIDGKGLGALEHDADGVAQKNYRSHDGTPYWLARSLRAVLTSADARPCLDQMPIAARSNEMSSFAAFFAELMRVYGAGDLFEIVTVDAGLTSRANADLVAAADKAYLMALKGTQPELLAEAQRLLGGRRDPDAETDWEPYQGARVRRRFFRTAEIAGYHDWPHLRQAWLVATTVLAADGTAEIERRYFLTNLPWGRLTAAQCLRLVRRHWGIENDCFWTLDVQWREDALPWCTQGRAVEVLSWLRLMAYNLLQLARRTHLRRRDAAGVREPPPAWRRVFAWVRQALQRPPLTQALLTVDC